MTQESGLNDSFEARPTLTIVDFESFSPRIVSIDWRYQVWKAGVTVTDNVSE